METRRDTKVHMLQFIAEPQSKIRRLLRTVIFPVVPTFFLNWPRWQTAFLFMLSLYQASPNTTRLLCPP